jgi:hypothetical protein
MFTLPMLNNSVIRKITPNAFVTTIAGAPQKTGSADGVGKSAFFNFPIGVAVDRSGNVYVSDYNNENVRKISPTGVVKTLAGSAGLSSTNDGVGKAALFSSLWGVAVDQAGNLYVADQDHNDRISKGTAVLQFDTSWGLSVSNGVFSGRVIGPSSSSVFLDGTSDFKSWLPLQTNQFSSGGINVSLQTNSFVGQFFRARLIP